MIFIDILFTFIIACILISISKEDLKTMKISENKLRIFAGFGFLYLIYQSLSRESIILITNNSFSMVIIFTLMYSISHISYKILHINSLGLGDIKLSAIGTLWLGIDSSLISLCISFLLSAIYSLHGKLTRNFKTLHQYPFAPFLSIGIFCSWILDKI